MSGNRRELLDKWLRKKYKPVGSYNEEKRPAGDSINKRQNLRASGNCRLKVEKKTSTNSETNSFKLGKKNRYKTTQILSSGTKTSSLLLGVGFSGFISVYDEKVEVFCQNAGLSNYRISLNIEGLNNSLATNLVIQKGQKINIGNIVNDLKNKKKDLGIPAGVNIKKTVGNESIEYFLTAQ